MGASVVRLTPPLKAREKTKQVKHSLQTALSEKLKEIY